MLPGISFKRLWHVGSLNAADKGVRGLSHEGSGLSVSTEPHAWTRIAKLGGYPTWVMARRDEQPGRFIDVHALTPEHWGALHGKARDVGLLEDAARFRVEWYDSESEDIRYVLFEDKDRAIAEYEDLADGGENESAKWSPVTVLAARRKLADYARQPVPDSLAPELALACMAEEDPAVDGLWWREDLDVFRHTAPRGVITLRALAQWTATQLTPT